MWDEDQNFEETVRSIAEELGRSVERALSQADVDRAAEAFGVDPESAREWVDSASGWLRARVEQLGNDVASRVGAHEPASSEPRREDPRREDDRGHAGHETRSGPVAEDPLSHAGPHPLDLPTEEQGLALAALDSGRWTVEPGSNALAAHGEGPGPSDALGLVRELRVRDWIAADGELTLAGRQALHRWLEATARH